MAGDAHADDPLDAARADYERKFDRTSKQLNELEKTSANTTEQAKEDVKKQEKSGGNIKTVRKKKPAEKRAPLGKRILGSMHHKSAFVFIAIVLLLGGAYISVLAPNIMLVNIKDLYTNDLADATTALSKYSLKMIGFKIGKADCGNKDTIKCKLTTMSRNQKDTLERHGFKVNGEKVEEDNRDDNDQGNDKKESRWKVSGIEFPEGAGTANDAESYAKLADSSDKVRYLTNGVWNPKSSFFMDTRFKQRIKDQFDLTKVATTYGTTEKEVDESFNKSMQGGGEKIDKAGQGAFSLKTLAGDGKNGLKDTSKTISNLANSYYGLQCAYYTMGKVAYNNAKKAKQVSVARFAMQYLKAADQIKSGIHGIDRGEIVINTLSGKLAWSSDGGYAGANATDESMYRHIVLRESFGDAGMGVLYQGDSFDIIGKMLPAWLPLFVTAKAVKGIGGLSGNLTAAPADISAKTRDYCIDGQKDSTKTRNKPNDCPALTISGTPPPMIGAVAPIAATSDRICPMPPKGCCWMMYPTTRATADVVMPYVAEQFISAVSGWADNAAKSFTADTKGEAASIAVFAGTGEILGDMAMSRGMRPADKDSLKEYLAEKAKVDQKYEQTARYAASKEPFNIYNQYSFAGSLIRSLGAAPSSRPTIFSTFTSVLSLVPASVKKLDGNAKAIYNLQPDELDTSRLKCPDAEYLNIGIDADATCNVRYSMSSGDMDANMKDVLDYMLKEHSDITKKNVDELKKRLDETDNGADTQDKQDVQRQYDEAKEANGKPFIDEKTGAPIKNSEYDKFIRYCVDRRDPWGRTGLDVRRDELPEDEKQKRHDSKDPDGNQVGTEGMGSEYELIYKAAYMAVTEGAAADQDWYTGKKCLEESEMLKNFRAYTMGCSVDGSFAGSIDCTEADREGIYTDDFYTSNDIHYISWF